MELKQLESFVSVADSQSFSKAAKSLYLTQPTISTHIAQLEKELGVKLFERTTKSLKLTETGRRIYPFAKRMIGLRDSISSEAGSVSDKPLSIAASTIPATYLLPSVLASFTAEEGIEVRVMQGNSADVEELVADGVAEAGIIGRKPETDCITGELLCEDVLMLVTPVSDHYTELKKSGAGIERLIREPMILREEGSGTQQAADLFLEKYGKEELNIVLRSNNQEAIKRMIAAGAGVSVMSGFAAADLERSGKAYCYPVRMVEPRCFYVIYREGRTLTPPVKRLIAMAHEAYR